MIALLNTGHLAQQFAQAKDMVRLKRYSIALALIYSIMIPFGSVWDVSAQSSDQLIERLRTRYDAMESMRTHFEQTTSSTYLDDTEFFEGEILIQGDQYRIEMSNQTIVANTEQTWVYNRSEHQVLLNDYELDENTFSLSTFLSEFDTAYDIVEYGSSGTFETLELQPQDPFSLFRTVKLFADGDIVVRLEILDLNDVHMVFELSDIQFNPTISSDSFIFSVPDGAEVVDLRDN